MLILSRKGATTSSGKRCEVSRSKPTARHYARPARHPEPTCASLASAMAAWIYFIHPPREDFAATMSDEERAVWAEHVVHLKKLLADGTLVLAGPTLGRINTGVAIIEA